jgi:hypothetical protein
MQQFAAELVSDTNAGTPGLRRFCNWMGTTRWDGVAAMLGDFITQFATMTLNNRRFDRVMVKLRSHDRRIGL